MRKSYCFSVLACIVLPGLTQAQAGASGTAPLERRDEISMVIPPISQPRAHIESRSFPLSQLFECDGNVTLAKCKQEMLTLQVVLNKYQAGRLGQWKWILVSSQRWQMLLLRLGLSPNVPAFTLPEQRVTFFEDTLVGESPERLSRLMDTWHLSRVGLLDLAVRHELGHALCKAVSESGAIRTARILEERKPLSCEGGPFGR
jgi:hypothetical protein